MEITTIPYIAVYSRSLPHVLILRFVILISQPVGRGDKDSPRLLHITKAGERKKDNFSIMP